MDRVSLGDITLFRGRNWNRHGYFGRPVLRHIGIGRKETCRFMPYHDPLLAGGDSGEDERSIFFRVRICAVRNHENRRSHVAMNVTINLHHADFVEFDGPRLAPGIVAEIELLGFRQVRIRCGTRDLR